MELLISSKYPLYIPRIALIEITALTKRKIGSVPNEILNFISKHFNVIKEEDIWNTAIKIAEETECRAVDSYYIAKKTNFTLITADKTMTNNAKNTNITTILIK